MYSKFQLEVFRLCFVRITTLCQENEEKAFVSAEKTSVSLFRNCWSNIVIHRFLINTC